VYDKIPIHNPFVKFRFTKTEVKPRNQARTVI